jgi:hypothetical protein
MSTQELLAEIQKLPLEKRQQLMDALTGDMSKGAQTDQPMSEDEVERILFARGIIGEIPDPSAYTDEDEDFEPIEVPGQPLSETIIEERR